MSGLGGRVSDGDPRDPRPTARRAPARDSALSLRSELARKSLHLTSAAVPVGYAAGVPRGTLLALLAVLLVIAVLVELTRRRVAIVRTHFHQATGQLLRTHEHDGWSGATWMLAAFTGAVWLLPASAAVAAMWAVAVGDASAAVVGRWVGRVRLGPSRKTLEGSLACLTAAAAGALLVARLDPAASLAAGLAAAAAEWPDGPLDDNLRVATAVALAVTLTHYLTA